MLAMMSSTMLLLDHVSSNHSLIPNLLHLRAMMMICSIRCSCSIAYLIKSIAATSSFLISIGILLSFKYPSKESMSAITCFKSDKLISLALLIIHLTDIITQVATQFNRYFGTYFIHNKSGVSLFLEYILYAQSSCQA
jgi:hypothetical protein